MATHDYNLANQSGSSFRTDLNNCLSAIVSLNSNGSEPSTTFAYMLWADTSNNLLQMRNSSNNGWIELRQLDGGMAMSEDATINSITVGKGANSVAGNTVVGEDALDAAVTGQNNTALGKEVLSANTSGTRNTAIGRQCMDANTLGDDNTACGVNALSANIEADDNVAVGAWAMEANTTGEYNTACGTNALNANVGASYNSAFGYKSLLLNTSGAKNTALGAYSMQANTSGTQNVSLGYYALDTNNIGNYNSALGYESLTANTEGEYNTACGHSAGAGSVSGDNNTFLGYQAGTSSAPGNVTAGSNNICVGNNSVTDAFIKVVWTVTSDRRDKTDITNFTHGLSWINKLNPVTYRWDNRSDYEDGKPDGSKKSLRLNLGLIAQDELEVEKEHGFGDTPDNMLITHIDDGGNYGMQYVKLVPILINAVKELSVKVTALEGG